MHFSALVEPLVRRAHEHLIAGDSSSARAELVAAAAAARQANDPSSEIGASLAHLQALGDASGAEATLEPLEQLAETARSHGLDELYALVVLERADRLRSVRRFGDAAHHAQVMVAWGQRIERPVLVGAAALSLGLSLRAAGRIEDANGAFNDGLWAVGPMAGQPAEPRDPLFPSLPPPHQILVALLIRHAEMSLELGLLARARESLGALAAMPLAVVLRAMVAAMSVNLARLEGRRPSLEHLRAVAAELLEQPASASSVSLLCQLAIVDGDPAFALPILDELAVRARSEDPALALETAAALAEVSLARARVWFLAGRFDEAAAELAAVPADGTAAVERLVLIASLALARGTPRLAIEPALMAAALAESREQAAHTAAAWHLAVEVYRRVGLVEKAREAREQAATLYRRSGLKAGLAGLEIERAWEALIERRDDEAAEVLAALAGVTEPKVAAQVALAMAALAARRGRPGDALPALLAAHDRLAERGASLLAVPLARAAQILSESGGRTVPASVSASLAWAAERQLPEVDVLYIPSPYQGDTEETNAPS